MSNEDDPETGADPANPGDGPPSPFEGVGSDIVSQLALTAFTNPDPISFAVAVVGPLLPKGLGLVAQRAKAFKKKREDATLILAAAAAGDDAEEMVRRIENDPNLSGFVDTAVNAGGNSTYPSRIRALGAALAAGVLANDADLVDVEQMVIHSLGQLERPHFRVLELMTKWEDGNVTRRRDRWKQSDLFATFESLRPVLHRLLADLESTGVLKHEFQIENFNTTGRNLRASQNRRHNWWLVTDFGLTCMQRLYDVGLAEDLDQWASLRSSRPPDYNIGRSTLR